MKKWLRRILIATVVGAIAAAIFYESATHTGRGWLAGEPYYDGRPASFWANEIALWDTKDPDWRTVRIYVRQTSRWFQSMLPEPTWPGLLDGDPDGLPVLQWLGTHGSDDVQDWARIGMERIDSAERGPVKYARLDVGFTAQVFDVDEAMYKKVADFKWRSFDDLEKLEQRLITAIEEKRAPDEPFDPLKKQVPLKSVEDIKIKERAEGLLFSLTETKKFLPTPTHLRMGRNEPQVFEEGMSFRVQASISTGARFVRAKFIEKIVELDGVDRIPVLLDNSGRYGKAELISVKQTEFSTPRNIPDGGTVLLPLQYRSADAKQKGRWLVVRVTPLIYIEEEQRDQRGK